MDDQRGCLACMTGISQTIMDYHEWTIIDYHGLDIALYRELDYNDQLVTDRQTQIGTYSVAIAAEKSSDLTEKPSDLTEKPSDLTDLTDLTRLVQSTFLH